MLCPFSEGISTCLTLGVVTGEQSTSRSCRKVAIASDSGEVGSLRDFECSLLLLVESVAHFVVSLVPASFFPASFEQCTQKGILLILCIPSN